MALPARFALVFALGIATAASAQFVRFDEHQKRLDEARQLLAGRDAQSIAWGAFNVASYQLPGLTKELTAALDRVTADDGAGSFAVNALLDAVVQTNAAVPASTLERYWQRWPVQTIVAFRNATGNRDGMLLRRLATLTGYEWFAVANMLLEKRTTGFAAELLARLRLRLEIQVVDADSGAGASVGSGGGILVGDAIGQNLAGFPPFVAYRFEGTLPRAGTTAVSTGPQPVFYSRQVHDTYQFGISTSEQDGPSDNDRLIYLQHLSGNTWQAGVWPAYHAESIPWRGEAVFQEQVSDQRELELERYRLLLSELVQANRLSTDDERRFAVPNLQITVVDRRTDQSRALPAFAR